MCRHLGLEGLVLLMFGLDVGRVLVVLLLGQLQLLQHPGLDLISIPGELLEGLMLTELGSLLNQSLLQLFPALQYILLLLLVLRF